MNSTDLEEVGNGLERRSVRLYRSFPSFYMFLRLTFVEVQLILAGRTVCTQQITVTYRSRLYTGDWTGRRVSGSALIAYSGVVGLSYAAAISLSRTTDHCCIAMMFFDIIRLHPAAAAAMDG